MLALANLAGLVSLTAATYHVDGRHGDDARAGVSPETAWRSIEKINATVFQPGDRILLRAGSAWEGVALRPLGSGTPEQPIVLGRYGDGPKPALHGRGRVPWVLGLQNQEGWELCDLEITNFTEGPRQRHRAVRA